jgi:hypothetical protein
LTVISLRSLLSLLKISAIAIVFCLVLVVGFEAAARLLLPDLVGSWRALAFGGQRILFVSEGAFENKAGYFNFAPNSRIRELAYYPEEKGGFSVEYDCTFLSDRLGFVSNTIPYEDSTVLLLGDSFSQGSGGCPWIPRLEPDVRSQVYSAAVLGTGVKHWRNILTDLERVKKPEKILIVFITHDFYRDDWLHGQSQLDCLSGAGECRGQFWYPISDGMPELAAQRHALRAPGIGDLSTSRFWRQHFIATFTLIKKLRRRVEKDSQLLQDSVRIVSDLAAKYPLRMIWVNEKSEADEPGPRTLRLWKSLEGIDVTRCPIPRTGFLVRDEHPNASGYDVLKKCVEGAVRSWGEPDPRPFAGNSQPRLER